MATLNINSSIYVKIPNLSSSTYNYSNMYNSVQVVGQGEIYIKNGVSMETQFTDQYQVTFTPSGTPNAVSGQLFTCAYSTTSSYTGRTSRNLISSGSPMTITISPKGESAWATSGKISGESTGDILSLQSIVSANTGSGSLANLSSITATYNSVVETPPLSGCFYYRAAIYYNYCTGSTVGQALLTSGATDNKGAKATIKIGSTTLLTANLDYSGRCEYNGENNEGTVETNNLTCSIRANGYQSLGNITLIPLSSSTSPYQAIYALNRMNFVPVKVTMQPNSRLLSEVKIVHGTTTGYTGTKGVYYFASPSASTLTGTYTVSKSGVTGWNSTSKSATMTNVHYGANFSAQTNGLEFIATDFNNKQMTINDFPHPEKLAKELNKEDSHSYCPVWTAATFGEAYYNPDSVQDAGENQTISLPLLCTYYFYNDESLPGLTQYFPFGYTYYCDAPILKDENGNIIQDGDTVYFKGSEAIITIDNYVSGMQFFYEFEDPELVAGNPWMEIHGNKIYFEGLSSSFDQGVSVYFFEKLTQYEVDFYLEYDD